MSYTSKRGWALAGIDAAARTDSCGLCGRATTYDDLGAYGARCRDCYAEYCRGGPCGDGFRGDRPRSVGAALARMAKQPAKHPASKVAAGIRRIAAACGSMTPRQAEMLRSCERVCGEGEP
jgi:hypothetical protein